MYFGLRVKPPPAFPERPHDDTRCVLVPASAPENAGRWAENLYEWARLRDPTLLVLPNESRGFSKVRHRDLEIAPAEVPAYEFQVEAMAEKPHSPIAITGPETPLTEKLLAAWRSTRPARLEPVIIQPFARGIFWRFHDGRPLTNPPDVSMDAVRSALNEAGFPKYPTSIRVSRLEASPTARVRVLQSCGNPVLDNLAVRAVRQAVGRLELQERTPGAPREHPGFLPDVGGSMEFEVEWSVPVESTL